MSVLPMDVDTNEEAAEVPSSSTSKGDKKRFEVKKVSMHSLIDWSSMWNLSIGPIVS